MSGDATPDWVTLSRQAAFASHRLVGWIYWDPPAVAAYAALGVPDGIGYYIATRGASLGDAGNGAVTAAFGSIHPDFVNVSLDLCREHASLEAAAAVRDAAVADGLRTHVPGICDDLAALATPLWAAADALPPAGRVLFATLRDRPRPSDDDVLSAWLAVNCIREWRGDTHWAMNVAEDIDEIAAGVLDGAWRGYEGDWLPRSRGADDAMVAAAMGRLADRGLVTDGLVNADGIAYRQNLEDRLDAIASAAWRHLGAERTQQFVDLIEPVGDLLVQRIDETAGPNWMPAARERRSPHHG